MGFLFSTKADVKQLKTVRHKALIPLQYAISKKRKKKKRCGRNHVLHTN